MVEWGKQTKTTKRIARRQRQIQKVVKDIETSTRIRPMEYSFPHFNGMQEEEYVVDGGKRSFSDRGKLIRSRWIQRNDIYKFALHNQIRNNLSQDSSMPSSTSSTLPAVDDWVYQFPCVESQALHKVLPPDGNCSNYGDLTSPAILDHLVMRRSISAPIIPSFTARKISPMRRSRSRPIFKMKSNFEVFPTIHSVDDP